MARMKTFASENCFRYRGKHHEIYLGEPAKGQTREAAYDSAPTCREVAPLSKARKSPGRAASAVESMLAREGVH